MYNICQLQSIVADKNDYLCTMDMRNKTFYILVLFLVLSSFFNLSAQSRMTVTGFVVDSLTNERMEFITIQEKGTTNGTITDTEGQFSITVKPGAEIIFSCVGYNSKTIKASGKMRQMKIQLLSADRQLSEVVVKPKRERYRRRDNPSVALAKKAIEHKDDHSIYQHDYGTCERYDKMTYSFNNFDEGRIKAMKKRFDFIEHYIDTASLSGSPVLPISSQEKIETHYFRKSPNTKKTIVEAFRSAGVEDMMPDGIVQAVKTEIFPEIDITDNNVFIFTNKFVSPLSSFAPAFYKFYILDTLKLDDGNRYIDLGFAPLVAESMGFVGHLYVSTDSTYYVKRAEMNIPPDINLNFVKNMRIVIDNERMIDTTMVDGVARLDTTRVTRQMAFDSEVNVTDNTIGLYARRVCTYNSFSFEQPTDTSVFNRWGPSFDSPEINNRDEAYWDFHRYGVEYNKDKTVESMLAQMRQVKLFYYGEKILTMLFKGYVPLGNKPYEENKWLYGPLNASVSYNSFEGIRLRGGGISTARFNKQLFFMGYAAYGTKDNEWKYNGSVEYSFREKKMHANEFPIRSLKLSYGYDTHLLGQDPTTGKDNFMLSMKRNGDEQITYLREAELLLTNEFWSGFSYKLSLNHKREYATRFTTFNRVGDGSDVPHYDMTSATLTLRYAPHETFIQSRTSRSPINHQHPVFVLTHTAAKSGVLGSDFDYQRTDFKYTQRIWLSAFGYVDVNLMAGKLWTQSPFTMLCIPNANLSYTIQKESFALMNAMEFVNDRYASWDLVYFLNGWVFNSIPLFKRLKWREVASFRGIIGDISRKNDPTAVTADGRPLNPYLFKFPGDGVTYKMGNQPYMEYALGIENILKCIRVDYVHRINYHSHENVKKHGVQVTMHWTF